MTETKVLLWSGGVYSTSLLISEIKNGTKVIPVYVDYGQKSSDAQLNACRKIMMMIRKDMLEASNLEPLQIFRVNNNVGLLGISFIIFGIGVSIAKDKDVALVIGSAVSNQSKNEGYLYDNAFLTTLRLAYPIIFPLSDNDIDVYAFLRSVNVPVIAYSFDCITPIKLNGSWIPCNTCEGCRKREAINNNLIA